MAAANRLPLYARRAADQHTLIVYPPRSRSPDDVDAASQDAGVAQNELALRRGRYGDVQLEGMREREQPPRTGTTPASDVPLADNQVLAHARAIATIYESRMSPSTDTEVEALGDLQDAIAAAPWQGVDAVDHAAARLVDIWADTERGVSPEDAAALEDPLAAFEQLGLRQASDALGRATDPNDFTDYGD